jgi:HEAT repeats
MAVTMEEVRAVLDPDEPDYSAAILLGPDALPHLQVLAAGDDPMLASKATYAAGLIGGEDGVALLREAASSEEPVVRVAAAATAANLSAEESSELLTALVSDPDPGVRKVARNAVPEDAPAALREQVEGEPDEPSAGDHETIDPRVVHGLMPGEQPGGAGTMPGEHDGLMPGEKRRDMDG